MFKFIRSTTLVECASWNSGDTIRNSKSIPKTTTAARQQMLTRAAADSSFSF
jgi:hypothetical protein